MIKQVIINVFPPALATNIQQVYGTQHICFDECKRVNDRPVDVTFRSQVDHMCERIFCKQAIDKRFINDISLFECVVWRIFYILQVFQVACICKCIEVNDLVSRIFFYEPAYNMRTDESRPACNKYFSIRLLHYKLQYCLLLILFLYIPLRSAMIAFSFVIFLK
jgi:hypothetical protein